jgi:hypothetical protein
MKENVNVSNENLDLTYYTNVSNENVDLTYSDGNQTLVDIERRLEEMETKLDRILETLNGVRE